MRRNSDLENRKLERLVATGDHNALVQLSGILRRIGRADEIEALERKYNLTQPAIPVIFRAIESRNEAKRKLRTGEPNRLYVTSSHYNPDIVERILRDHGARICARSHLNGWENQSLVVVFSGISRSEASNALINENMTFGGIYVKDWGGDGIDKQPVDVIALFPTMPSGARHREIESFELKGGYSYADYIGCITRFRAATQQEYAATLAELIRIGNGLKYVVYARRREFDAGF